MTGLDSLYQELILDHSKHPVGNPLHDVGDAAHADSHQKNPVCGDEITLRVAVDGDRITEVSWEGTGCSISQASASMLASLVEEEVEGDGMTRADAAALIERFREALRSRGSIPLDEETFGDAAALSGVSKFSARVKCAMLAWVALEDGLGRA
ncbi:SUF system NifU family Fe-S cluster assembly protein [Microbacterium sp. NE2HP2]|jgi:nitrogen fixation NifU-like protein|uniref:Fe-S cluster assembly sulfur transfer protein SufU n=2 Tax=Microbacterium TaxID=33882 RepID=A0ABV5EP70_9MICO|nr:MULTISPECIES: SUF system NifU family Fe-S cluster assembly protein [Microbacterium]APF34520.1 SUF system NifU family Fe-S cluster assembly protein [Microbacterium paludicola]MCZ4067105.1 SUF system NifU family Fe-S cluster assembly protein [Microbacterium sp. H37-C3]MDD7944008.1 SUF system NifU family Fe-S cluster assembly protein [Microbacterium plantarum]OAZ44468.1 SUF system NifU family Fe-S cluster assembly protein [Microbacterium arborescens]OWP23345.1 iron-sulfur cluster assembly scaf